MPRAENENAAASGPTEGDKNTSPLLDASILLDLAQVQRDWSDTLEERRTLEARTQRAFRSESGAPTPSSVVQSAEGPMLFPGLHVSNNGSLSKVARAALQESFPSGAELPPDDEDT